MKKNDKIKIISEFSNNLLNTGSVSVQIALLTKRINELSIHFKKHKNDLHSRYGLFRIISNRRRLLNYIKRKNIENYKCLIKKLDLRDKSKNNT